jgi:deazaflavin-dependent oxidoreductase (nitroreductase family)
MPLPEGLARFNRVATNRVVRPFARRIRMFGVLRHKGRKSGRTYETPVNVFPDGDRILVPLVYGSDVDWLENARAAERSEFVIGGESVPVGSPTILVEPTDDVTAVPGWTRLALAAIGVTEFADFPRLDSGE